MRNTFVETVCELAAEDNRIFLLCGDLGFSVLEIFASRFPGRFINIGVAEQNMTGIAAGLALSGKIVFTYSIANFPVMRCLEQIRNDVCYHKANVKIVSVGAGLAYGPQGYTHHGLEDMAVMQAMPNMKVIAPADPIETRLATRAIARDDGPCYLRLGKAKEPVVHKGIPEFEIGKSILVRPGNDLTIVTTGAVLDLALQAAEVLATRKVEARVLSMHTVDPLDGDALDLAAQETNCMLAVEEHGWGGLSTAVAERLGRGSIRCRFDHVSFGHLPFGTAGSQKNLRARASITLESILDRASGLLQAKARL